MAKIMLVEDDNNLREIYEARLLAEGYEIVAAKDGEEALAMAVKEKPDLIIADIMMPKISGFDMLDILRSTAETKNTKVIVMTALSQAEDKARADKLGADRYLVKSQVTLEDVAKAAHDVLENAKPAATNPAASANETPAAAPITPTPAATPVAEPPASVDPPVNEPPTADPASEPPADLPSTVPVINLPVTEPPTPTSSANEPVDSAQTGGASTAAEALAESAKQEKAEVNEQIKDTGIAPPKDMVEPPKNSELPVLHEKVIQPPADMDDKPDIHQLLAEEEAKEQADQPVTTPPADTVISANNPEPVDPEDVPAGEPHSPGQVIGPDTTPGSDPTKPHDIAL